MKSTQVSMMGTLCVALTFLLLSAPRLVPQEPAPESSDLNRENGRRHQKWNLEWYGEEWSQSYRDQLYKKGILQRIVHAQTLKLAASMQRGTFLPAPVPGNAWLNLGPADGGVDYDVTEFGSHFQLTLNAAADSGRPNQIVPHPLEPDTVFLVSAEGGLWKTTNAGTSWSSLTEGEPSLALGALAVDPVKPSILYLGLGDIEEASFGGTGTGILKSEDGGQTWTKPVILGKSRAVTSVLVSPKNTSVILAGTESGLFRSTDSGETYSQVALPTGNPKTIRDLTWIADSQIVLTAGNNFDFGNGAGGANILVTEDGGASWKPASGLGSRASIRRFSLAVAPGNRKVLYALASDTHSELFEIFKSADGGKSWSATGAKSILYDNPVQERKGLTTLLGGQGGYNQVAIVDPDDPDTAYFGGNLNLAKTTDGGVSYSVISDWLGAAGLPYVHADFHCAAFDKKKRLWMGNDGGLAVSNDQGKTWSTAQNRGLTTHLVYSIGSSTTSQNVITAGLQDNGTRVRSGVTNVFHQRIYADGFGTTVHQVNSNVLLGSAYFTRILKSLDGGKTFHGSSSGIAEANQDKKAPFFTKIIAVPADTTGNTVYTFVNDKVYRSKNFGDSWSPIEVDDLTGTIRNLGVAASDEQSLALVSSDGAVHLSTNGGLSWQRAPGSLPGSQGRLSYVSFSPVDPKVLYVASVAPNINATHLWKSTDRGAHWQAIDKAANFPHGVPVNTVVGDPGESDTIYAGTHLGLYKSTDGGENWVRFGFGLPLVSVTDVYVSPDSSLLRVATYGRGIWQLTE